MRKVPARPLMAFNVLLLSAPALDVAFITATKWSANVSWLNNLADAIIPFVVSLVPPIVALISLLKRSKAATGLLIVIWIALSVGTVVLVSAIPAHQSSSSESYRAMFHFMPLIPLYGIYSTGMWLSEIFEMNDSKEIR